MLVEDSKFRNLLLPMRDLLKVGVVGSLTSASGVKDGGGGVLLRKSSRSSFLSTRTARSSFATNLLRIAAGLRLACELLGTAGISEGPAKAEAEFDRFGEDL